MFISVQCAVSKVVCVNTTSVPVGKFSEKIAHLVGRLGSGPRLMADRPNVVFTHTRQKLQLSV